MGATMNLHSPPATSQVAASIISGEAGRPSIVWVDLTRGEAASVLVRQLSACWRVIRVTRAEDIVPAIRQAQPLTLCFDFERPRPEDLQALHQTRLRYPGLPVLMLSAEHSEELAVWALRARVWDYLAKPVVPAELHDKLAMLLRQRRAEGLRAPAPVGFSRPDGALEATACLQRSCRTAPALAHIGAHFQEKIALATLARLCHLSPSQFSRVFRREHGITFSAYLMRLRIDKARELLACPPVLVTQVGFAVGFNDLSYFSRMFRRLVGVPPTRYATKDGDS